MSEATSSEKNEAVATALGWRNEGHGWFTGAAEPRNPTFMQPKAPAYDTDPAAFIYMLEWARAQEWFDEWWHSFGDEIMRGDHRPFMPALRDAIYETLVETRE